MSFDLGLIDQLVKMNKDFTNRLEEQQKFEKHVIRKLIEEHIGNFKLEYKTFEFRKVFAIDGSLNTYGEQYPFIIHLLRAGAFGSGNIGFEKSLLLYGTKIDIQEKLKEIIVKYGLESEELAFDFLKKKEMARLEVLMGIEIINTQNPDLIMFDGGLLRYKSLCPYEYQIYKKLALDKKIVTVGVIEDIGTFLIPKTLTEKNNPIGNFQYDREVLYGLLSRNESLIIEQNLEFKEDIQTVFCRFSEDPNPIGIDIFEHDNQYLEQILSLVKNTTNINSRGIPFLIDKVDEYIKIKNETVEKLITRYIEPEILEKYFKAKRRKR